MEDSYKFRITENSLHKGNNVGLRWLRASNSVSDVKIFYYGNYDEDLANGKLDINSVLVDCELRLIGPQIKYMAGHIYVGVPLGELLPLHRVEEYADMLIAAKKTSDALIDLLKEYQFPAESG